MLERSARNIHYRAHRGMKIKGVKGSTEKNGSPANILSQILLSPIPYPRSLLADLPLPLHPFLVISMLKDFLVNYVDWSQQSLLIAALSICFNPLFWNIAARQGKLNPLYPSRPTPPITLCPTDQLIIILPSHRVPHTPAYPVGGWECQMGMLCTSTHHLLPRYPTGLPVPSGPSGPA